MVLKITGTDITGYIAPGGVKWTRADVDGAAAGRMLDASMTRDRIAIKRRLDITCRALTFSEMSVVLSLIEPEFVSVTYTDPTAGSVVNRTFYSNNFSLTLSTFKWPDGTEMWTGLSFPLIEK